MSLICQRNTKYNTMKYSSVLIIFLLFNIFGSYSQVLEESFENWPPAGWTLNPESGAGSWVQNNGDFPTSAGNAGPGSAYEGDYAAMFSNYDYLPAIEGSITSPIFDLSSLTYPLLKFYWWNNDGPLEPAQLIVYASSDGINFITLNVIETAACGDWTEYYTLLDANIIQIKLTAISDYGIKNTYVDAFSIEEAPSCLGPSNLMAENIGPHSVEIDWANGNNESAWNIEYGLAGFAQGSGTIVPVSSHPFLLEELETNTNYDVYVQSDCGAEQSAWSDPLSFSTSCETITSFPYLEGFENFNLGCFSVQQSNPVETWYWTNETAFIGPYAGIGYARIAYSLSPQDEWLISPSFNFANVENASLVFHWSLSYTYSMEPYDNYDLILKVTTNGGLSWTSIWDESQVGVFENWIYYEETVDLSAFAGQENVQFAFNYVGADGAAAYLDEITVDVQLGTEAIYSTSNNMLSLYPNPASHEVNIKSKNLIQQINVYNIQGQLVIDHENVNSFQTTLNTNSLSKGQYIVKVKGENEILTESLSIF